MGSLWVVYCPFSMRQSTLHMYSQESTGTVCVADGCRGKIYKAGPVGGASGRLWRVEQMQRSRTLYPIQGVNNEQCEVGYAKQGRGSGFDFSDFGPLHSDTLGKRYSTAPKQPVLYLSGL